MQFLVEAGLTRSQRPLPSWVPDWSLSSFWRTYNFSKKHSWISLKGIQENEKFYGASSHIEIRGWRTLRVLGNVVDKITELSNSVPNNFGYNRGPEDPARIDSSIAQLYIEAKVMVSQLSPNLEEGISILQNTFLGGSEGYFKPLSAAYMHSKILGQHAAHGEDNHKAIRAFDIDLRQRLSNRRFCLTENDYAGLVPSIAEVGDSMAWLKGEIAPFVLRKSGSMYDLIDDAFLNSFLCPINNK